MTAPAHTDLAAVAKAAWQRCRDDDFAGHDPYDGLKSRWLAPLLVRSRWLRIGVIQAVKRSPWNLRPLLGIPRGHNPKGLALLMLAAADRPEFSDAAEQERIADLVAGLASHPDGRAWIAGRDEARGRAGELASAGPSALGWGYDFPWQSRAFLQPAYFPTVVATSFVVDAFAAAGHPAAAAVTRAAAGFVRDHLHRHTDHTGVCYSYSPRDRTRVFNASLFAGKILARAARDAAADEADVWRREAALTADYVVARQREDGGWIYGEADHWQWIDNLHTGFVLETIDEIARLVDTPDRWTDATSRGLAFYRAHLLAPDGTPRYHADGAAWLDSHTVAQTALTLLRFADRDPGLVAESRRVLERGVAGLWQPQRRGFSFQCGRGLPNHTVFLRWSQAWMLRALGAQLVCEGNRP
jgi:hypothetical protein